MEYLMGMLGLGLVWAIIFLARVDLRRRVLWAGLFYTVLMTAGFFAATLVLHVPPDRTIDPGYWSPQTLFNLNAITGGFSIEDVMFLFFFGGIAGIIYELVTRTHPSHESVTHITKVSIAAGVVASAVVAYAGANLMYSIITFGCIGSLVTWLQRPDLIRRSLTGGVAFLALYVVLYSVFLQFFPGFVAATYHLENVSGVVELGIPLEEYLFAFWFGALWSVLYSYRHDLR